MPPRRKVDFETVRKVAHQLAEVEDSTSYGTPSLKVRGQLLACIAINKSAEPGSLMIRVPFDRRDELIAEAPDIYYVTDHYVSYPSVLVRMSRVHPDALKDLLSMSLTFVANKKTVKKATKKARTR